jgi:MIP family channel proteins
VIKRYVAEFIGTFTIIFAPIAVGASAAMGHTDHGLLIAALVSGLPVLAMIYALGPICAAHFNPAVTLGFALARRFPWKFVLPYWVAQMLGSVAAAGLAFVLFGASSGAHVPSDPSAILRNLGIEMTISAMLMFVIISVATDRRIHGTIPALAIGFTVVVGVLIGGPITGGSMNPARSFGPALFTGGAALASYWLYVVGPMVGASIAAFLYEAIRLEPEHAKGAPDDLVQPR